MIDHVTVNVRDYQRSKAFYDRTLAPLGIKLVAEFGTVGGYGRGDKPELWIGGGKTTFQTVEQLRIITPMHIALIALSRADVDAFYKAALEAGATDHGAPGLREMYHPGYYGAFVLDPDGHNLEAVHHSAG
ncbi:VOC family protein [Labilithrix luteola]|uniref:VOC family protein n=1 Tax=Labilithrix luteola TaxID=1391654 RepID=UPI0011BA7A62